MIVDEASSPASDSAAPAQKPRMPLHQAVQLARAQVLNPRWKATPQPPVPSVQALVSAFRQSGLSPLRFSEEVDRPEVTEAALFCWNKGCNAEGEEWPALQLAILKLQVSGPQLVEAAAAAPASKPPSPKADKPPPPPALPAGAVVEWLGGPTKPRDLPAARAQAIADRLRQFATPDEFLRAARAAGIGHPGGAGVGALVAGNKARAIVRRFPSGPCAPEFARDAWGVQEPPPAGDGYLDGILARSEDPPKQRAKPARSAGRGSPAATPKAPEAPEREESADGPRDDGAIELRLVVRPGDPLYPQAASLLRRRQRPASHK